MRHLLPLLLLPAAIAGSLHDQSLAALLAHDYPQPAVNYVLLDTVSRTVIASRWPADETPVPMGSVLKPFVALAWAREHHSPYPAFQCRGTGGGCWSVRPHGKLGMEEAVAQSCNAYFLELAAQVGKEEMESVSTEFGLSPPSKDTPAARIGLGHDWKATPRALALAYAELAERRSDPDVRPILAGMALSSKHGTGRALAMAALVKTGTAPCSHARRQPGDGFTVALFPADSPRYVLLVRVDGVPGSKAAATAGRMMRTVLDGK